MAYFSLAWQGNCTETDPYYDYAGTFRGVVEGACDVGFTKQVFTITLQK